MASNKLHKKQLVQTVHICIYGIDLEDKINTIFPGREKKIAGARKDNDWTVIKIVSIYAVPYFRGCGKISSGNLLNKVARLGLVFPESNKKRIKK